MIGLLKEGIGVEGGIKIDVMTNCLIIRKSLNVISRNISMIMMKYNSIDMKCNDAMV